MGEKGLLLTPKCRHLKRRKRYWESENILMPGKKAIREEQNKRIERIYQRPTLGMRTTQILENVRAAAVKEGKRLGG